VRLERIGNETRIATKHKKMKMKLEERINSEEK
jgi:hypothetical protein